MQEFTWKDCPNSVTMVFGIADSIYIEDEYHKRLFASRTIKRAYLRHYTRRKAAAIKIGRVALDCVWKPICKD